MMQNIFTKMYAIENFATYIMVAIGVLLFLFIVILILGKKDQKLEETKKLEKLEDLKNLEEKKPEVIEKSKEETKSEKVDILISPQKLESDIEKHDEKPESIPVEEVKELHVEKIEEKPLLEEVKPENIIINEEVKTFEFDPIPEVEKTVYEQPEKIEPIIAVKEEIELADFSFDDLEKAFNSNQEPAVEKEVREPKEPIIKKEEKPVIKIDDAKDTEKTQKIFSSVYIDTKDEEIKPIKIEAEKPIESKTTELKEEKTQFDLPKLKETPNSFEKFEVDSIPKETYKIDE